MKLLEYDTVIFDLDDTIWSGSDKDIWAKKLFPPLTYHIWTNRVYDYVGQYVQIQEGVRVVLKSLEAEKKNIGYTTIGGWEGTPYDWQPCTIVLRCSELEKYFLHMRVIQYKTGIKTKDFVPKGKTLFVDDNQKHLDEIKQTFPDVDLLHRHSFDSWINLL